MKKIRNWEVLRKELQKLAKPELLEQFDRHLDEKRFVHAIKLLRENGVQIEE